MSLFDIWWSGALVTAVICLYDNYKCTGKASINKIDIAAILLSWVTVIFWAWTNWTNFPRK